MANHMRVGQTLQSLCDCPRRGPARPPGAVRCWLQTMAEECTIPRDDLPFAYCPGCPRWDLA